MMIHGYEFTLKDKEDEDIMFQVLFQPIEVKINDKMVHLGKPVDAQKFALDKANEMLKKNNLRPISLSTGDKIRYIDNQIVIKADGFQEKMIKSNMFVMIPIKNCEGNLLRFK